MPYNCNFVIRKTIYEIQRLFQAWRVSYSSRCNIILPLSGPSCSFKRHDCRMIFRVFIHICQNLALCIFQLIFGHFKVCQVFIAANLFDDILPLLPGHMCFPDLIIRVHMVIIIFIYDFDKRFSFFFVNLPGIITNGIIIRHAFSEIITRYLLYDFSPSPADNVITLKSAEVVIVYQVFYFIIIIIRMPPRYSICRSICQTII